jgi:hypothetical protein
LVSFTVHHRVGKTRERAFLPNPLGNEVADLQDGAFGQEILGHRNGDLFPRRGVISGREPDVGFRHVVRNFAVIEFLSGKHDGVAPVDRSVPWRARKDLGPALLEFDALLIVGCGGQGGGREQLRRTFALVHLGPILDLAELLGRKIRHLLPLRLKSRFAARRQGQGLAGDRQ